MSNTNSLKALIKNIADAIRNRTSKSASMTIEEMPNEIASIQGPYPTQSKTVDVKKNGELIVEPDEGYVLDKVTANVDVVAVSDNNAKVLPQSVNASYGASNGIQPSALLYINITPYASQINKYYSVDRLFAYCSNLEKIDGLKTLTLEKSLTVYELFAGCSKLTSLDVSNFDTSSVTNMNEMFSNCSKLTSLDVSNFDTSSVTNMGSMFSNCSSLTSLDVSNFDTSSVTNMNSMFYNCSSLTSLDVSNFDTSSVTNMNSMFYNCSSLTSLDVSNFDTSKVTSMNEMFRSCKGLTSLDVSNFDTSNVTNMGLYDFYGIFASDNRLATVTFGNNWGSNEGLSKIKLGDGNGLNKASVLDLFNKLATRTNSPTLSLNNNEVKSQLTEEEIAIATNKGWVVS